MKLEAALLAPGDRRALPLLDRVDVELAEGAGFDLVFERLWAVFGPRREMEARELLLQERAGRFAQGWSVRYYPMLIRFDLDVVAVRDCVIAVAPDLAVVLLSHILVDERARRSGLAAFGRAAPLLFVPRDRPTLLFAEMEPLDEADPPTRVRLAAYHKAGFSLMGVRDFPYCQPDFERGGRPVPLVPVLRLVDLRGPEPGPVFPVETLRRGLDGMDAIHAIHDPTDLAVRRAAAEAAWAGRQVLCGVGVDDPAIGRAGVLAALPARMGGQR